MSGGSETKLTVKLEGYCLRPRSSCRAGAGTQREPAAAQSLGSASLSPAAMHPDTRNWTGKGTLLEMRLTPGQFFCCHQMADHSPRRRVSVELSHDIMTGRSYPGRCMR